MTLEKPKKPVTFFDYYKKTIKWMIGNTIIGLAPLLFLKLMNTMSKGRICEVAITRIIHDGVILFVCCAIMGSIVVDFILGGHKLQSGRYFLIIVIPVIVLALLLLAYFLMSLDQVSQNAFQVNTPVTISVIAFSIIYCIFAKTHLFIKEDTKQ